MPAIYFWKKRSLKVWSLFFHSLLILFMSNLGTGFSSLSFSFSFSLLNRFPFLLFPPLKREIHLLHVLFIYLSKNHIFNISKLYFITFLLPTLVQIELRNSCVGKMIYLKMTYSTYLLYWKIWQENMTLELVPNGLDNTSLLNSTHFSPSCWQNQTVQPSHCLYSPKAGHSYHVAEYIDNSIL